jgi:hypothetical protein
MAGPTSSGISADRTAGAFLGERGEVADLSIHGTTHERPIDRFARERLTPLGSRPSYRYERVRLRRVATDALGRSRCGALFGTGRVQWAYDQHAGERGSLSSFSIRISWSRSQT